MDRFISTLFSGLVIRGAMTSAAVYMLYHAGIYVQSTINAVSFALPHG